MILILFRTVEITLWITNYSVYTRIFIKIRIFLLNNIQRFLWLTVYRSLEIHQDESCSFVAKRLKKKNKEKKKIEKWKEKNTKHNCLNMRITWSSVDRKESGTNLKKKRYIAFKKKQKRNTRFPVNIVLNFNYTPINNSLRFISWPVFLSVFVNAHRIK